MGIHAGWVAPLSAANGSEGGLDFDALAGGFQPKSFSMSASMEEGLVRVPYLCRIFPSLSTRNLAKFQLISCVPASGLDLKYLNTGWAFAPFTFTLANIGKVTPYFVVTKFLMVASSSGS